MYCLQWLIPVLLIPKPVNPALLYNHVVFMILYLASFFIERKPCTICSLVFIFALILICTSGYGNCLFWNDEDQCPREAEGISKMWLILCALACIIFPSISSLLFKFVYNPLLKNILWKQFALEFDNEYDISLLFMLCFIATKLIS